MDKETIQREKKVILYGQSTRFRVIKYAILIPLYVALYFWLGWKIASIVLVANIALGIVVHFWMRWKTDGWRKSWGPYKTMFPEENH